MEWVDVLERVGVAITLVMALVYGVYKAGQFLGPRVSRMIDKHIETMEALCQAQRDSSDVLRSVLAHSEHLVEIHRDPASQFSTARTNHAIVKVAALVVAAAEVQGADVAPLRQQLQSVRDTVYGFALEKRE